MLFSIIYVLIEKGILGDSLIYPSTGNPYIFNLIVPGTLAFIFGLVIGAFEILFLSKWFRTNSFLKKMIFKTSIYMLILTLVMLITSTISNALELGVHPFDKQVWNNTFIFFSSFAIWTILIYFAMTVIICLFYTEVSDNMGQEVLANFFTGKYHHPIEEERIFMFLDMKSSTTIAEKLGHINYFRMLKEYYSDLSEPIIEFGGEVYQYVGDEVVVTWKLNNGSFNNNCLNCFFAMKTLLINQAEKYQSEFGTIPTFKAGIHLGEVTTGEIGVIKKEIAFSGDVLNTTARIQSLCNTYNVDLLISEQLISALSLGEEFQIQEIGKPELRGRNERINLFTVEKKKNDNVSEFNQ